MSRWLRWVSPSVYGHAICYPQDSPTITHFLLNEIVVTVGNFSLTRSWITYYVARSVLNYLRCRQWASRIRALDSSPKILLPYSKVYPLVLITLLSLHCQLFLTLNWWNFIYLFLLPNLDWILWRLRALHKCMCGRKYRFPGRKRFRNNFWTPHPTLVNLQGLKNKQLFQFNWSWPKGLTVPVLVVRLSVYPLYQMMWSRCDAYLIFQGFKWSRFLWWILQPMPTRYVLGFRFGCRLFS